jgi:hypothetical protein
VWCVQCAYLSNALGAYHLLLYQIALIHIAIYPTFHLLRLTQHVAKFFEITSVDIRLPADYIFRGICEILVKKNIGNIVGHCISYL